MAIHEQQITQIEGGFVKEIDSGAMNMLLDVFQKLQYSYPEKSTVRELVSNCIDATREREVAKKILIGQAKVEDYYVEKEGSEYKDSRFDPGYYDLKWLSNDPGIYITYKEGSSLEKDQLIISDNGVGLGSSRLLGYFSLGYSTKRLSGVGLGKFGMGAKAALATGVPFYVVKNRYNGIETHWSVSSHRVQSIIPKFNESGEENPILDLGNDMGAHYLKTNRHNGVDVIIEVKKHNKQKYIDAVRSQLLYFDHINFNITAHDGRVERLAVSAEILYEDKVMILSKNDYFAKPHILVNRVNYGLIDFQELELEDKMGNISIKLDPGEVSVSPNREKVIWDDTTREAIKRRFTEVQEAAEKLLQGELDQTDFMKWLKACIAIKNKIGTEQGSSVVSRLARLVDISNYAPVYKPDNDFKLNWELFAGMKVRKITGKTVRQGSTYKMIVDRTQAGLSDLVNGDLPVFIQQEDTHWLRDRYILEDLYQDGFITIMLNQTAVQALPSDATEDEIKANQSMKTAIYRHALDTAISLKWCYLGKDETLSTISDKGAPEAIEKVLDRWNRLNKYILSSEGIQFYDTIEVPENYKEQNKSVEEDGVIKQEEEVKTKEAQVSAEARRKLKGETILFTPRNRGYLTSDKTLYEWHKLEVPVGDIDRWENSEVYYSSEDSASLLKLATFITRPHEVPDGLNGMIFWNEEETKMSTYQASGAPNYTVETVQKKSYLTAYDGDTEVKLIKVAQNRVKYYQDFKHIHKFFAEIKNKTITMSNKLIKWNTARYINQYLDRLQFFNNFRSFDSDRWSIYQVLVKYHDEHYRGVESYIGKIKDIGNVEYSDMISHMDKVAELQVFVSENPNDTEAIAQLTKNLFGTGAEQQISDGCAIEMNIRNLVHGLLDYSEPLYVMLNQMPVLTVGGIISDELSQEIRNFIQFKLG